MFTIVGADGREYGPVAAEQLRQWMAESRVTLDMRAKRAGTEEWRTLRDFPEFAAPQTAAATGESPAPPAEGDAPAAALSAAGTTPAEHITFTGQWQEYFKIWIVNVLLTLVTFGIYAAWAKVRKRRYFCANTAVFGHTFEYLADPMKILYGNLIIIGCFGVFMLAGVFSPLVQIPLLLAFAVAVPWFIVRALMFNARNTAWRGLRFNFTGTYGESAKVYLLWPLLIGITLGLIFPLIAKKQKEFLVNRSTYGTSPFSFSAETSAFYKIYGVGLLFFLPIIIGYFAFIGMIGFNAAQGGIQPGQPLPPAAAGMFGLFMLVGLPLAFVGVFYIRARIFNYVWSNTSLAGNIWAASMRTRDLLLLQLVNSLVTLVTFGLMHPWVAVRMARYQLSCLEITPAGNIDTFVAAAQPPIGALGEAASDFFDFDFGFGV